MNKETTVPAFPSNSAFLPSGITIRDYFAAKIMQGIYANGEGHVWDRNKERAERAYKQADAMLEERLK